MKWTIRKATTADLPSILDLIKELAIYEKAPDAVTVTEEVFRQSYQENRFESYVAVSDNEIVGIILFYEAYSSWKGKYIYLDDFVVREKYRRYGIGRDLFEKLLKIGNERDMALIKWQVLDWNEPAINFYKKYKAVFDGEWLDCKIYQGDLKKWSDEGI